jgi:hypothetical protein
MSYTLDKKLHLPSGSMFDYVFSHKYIEAYDILIEYIKQKIELYNQNQQNKQNQGNIYAQ